MFLTFPQKSSQALPKYKGDLELTDHSAGSLTSQAYLKPGIARTNCWPTPPKGFGRCRMAGRTRIPAATIERRMDAGHGRTISRHHSRHRVPKAYEFSWNDEVLAMNQFAGVLTSATEAVASGMNTRDKGTPVVVYNPLNVEREDVVEATVALPDCNENCPRSRTGRQSDSSAVARKGTRSCSWLRCRRLDSQSTMYSPQIAGSVRFSANGDCIIAGKCALSDQAGSKR